MTENEYPVERAPTCTVNAAGEMEQCDEISSDPISYPITHQLYDVGQMTRAFRLTSSNEVKSVLSSLRAFSPCRELAAVPQDYLHRCEQLKLDFPNFSEFVDGTLVPELALQYLTGGAFQLIPAVFLGPPGVGKTMFLNAVADHFALPFVRMNLESAQSGFELVGVARGWTGTTPGLLLNWLAAGNVVNGIVAFEELEKSSGSDQFPVANTLLQLLEPATASAFSDASVPELRLDIRPMNFMFTANGLDGISGPLLSRLHIVEIPPLTVEQAQVVALRQYEQLITSLNLPVQAPRLTPAGLEVLSGESPRRQRILLRLALGRAVAEQRQELIIPRSHEQGTVKIGFV